MIRKTFACSLVALAMAGCSSGRSGSVAEEWLPKLQHENSITCQKDDCSDEVQERIDALTAELAEDARNAGEEYQGVAVLAERVNLAVRYWEEDCYPDGTFSRRAGMSCDDALTLSIQGPEQLEALIQDIARSEEPS
jgi:hypothetical protein